jgi:hypothetical protein
LASSSGTEKLISNDASRKKNANTQNHHLRNETNVEEEKKRLNIETSNMIKQVDFRFESRFSKKKNLPKITNFDLEVNRITMTSPSCRLT